MKRFLQSLMLGTGLAVATTASVSAFDVYIIGSNVNDHSWEPGEPSGLMTEISDGVYEWSGETLGTGFKFNDGTWNNDYFPDTEILANIGSNGDPLVLGEPYNFLAGSSTGNIMYADVDLVENPYVLLDLNEGTVTVTGDVLSVTKEYYLVGTFTVWQFLPEYKMAYDETANLYTLKGVEIREQEAQFMFATQDWMFNFGLDYSDYIWIGEVLGLTVNGNVIYGDFDGIYDIVLDPSAPSVLFTKVGDVTPTPVDIDYASFYVQTSNGGYANATPLEPTGEENVYMAYGIQLGMNGRIALGNPQNQFFAADGDVTFDDNSLSCTLKFWDGTQSWDPQYAFCQLSGKYDVKVTFDGENALLELSKVGEIVFDPSQVYMGRVLSNNENPEWIAPSAAEENIVVYSNVYFTDYSRIVFYDLLRDVYYGGSIIEDEEGWQYFGDVITPDNLTATVNAGSLYYVLIDGLEGSYDITVEFNEDLTSATITFAKTQLPEIVANYEGDLYLAGTVNGWELSDPAYKMTCVEPGVYEWSGEKLTSGFKVNGGDWTSFFPGTNLYIDFGGPQYPFNAALNLGEPYTMELRGSDIQFADEEMVVSNPQVTLNLHDMTLLVTGEVKHVVNIEDAILFTSDNDQYSAQATETGIKYVNVSVDGALGFALSLDGQTYGWESIDEDNIPWVTDESPETVIYSTNSMGHLPFYVYAYLEGVYTVYVDFNEDLTSATMRFEKTGEIYPYVNIAMENGTSFRYRSAWGREEKFTVSTNDEFWGITGYTMNGEEGHFERPLVIVTGTFDIPEEGLDILFYTEYLGECKDVTETTGIVEIGNAVTINRVADGVEIHGVEVGQEIVVYTLGGQVVSLLRANAADVTLNLEKGQVYIVRVGTVAAKVMM